MKVKYKVTVNNQFIFMRNNLKRKSVFKPVSIIFVGSVACCCWLMREESVTKPVMVGPVKPKRCDKTYTVGFKSLVINLFHSFNMSSNTD